MSIKIHYYYTAKLKTSYNLKEYRHENVVLADKLFQQFLALFLSICLIYKRQNEAKPYLDFRQILIAAAEVAYEIFL